MHSWEGIRSLGLAVLVGGSLAAAPMQAQAQTPGTSNDGGRGTQLHLESPLVRDVINGNVEAAKMQLLRAADPNTRDIRQGAPLLVHAARSGNLAMVALILDHRPRINGADHGGVTALMAAAAQDHAPVVRRLLEAGAAADATDRLGQTALMQAARAGALNATEALLAGGADPHAADYSGRTALDWARDGRNRRLVQALERARAR